MIKASVNLQELRRKIYLKAKSDKTWRFWGLYVHVCKTETLREAYKLAKKNNGAPGIEKAKEITKQGKYINIEYARFADDLVICVNDYYRWLTKAAYRRLVSELAKLKVKLNKDKTKIVDLTKGNTFSFLGFVYRRVKTAKGKFSVAIVPKIKARTTLLRKLKEIFARFVSQPVSRVIYLINPILRGWVNYFRIGHSSKCFDYVKGWVEKKIRRHLMRARKRHGFGWNRWSSAWLYNTLGLYNDYKIRYYHA